VQIGDKPALNFWRVSMVNAPDVSSQSTPDKQGDQAAERPSDNSLAENSQANLDARLDHAIEETFPTSDPVSVTITKGPEPDGPDQGHRSSSAGDQGGSLEQDSTEQILDQVREALNDVADQASGAAHEVYRRGEHYVRQAGERYPQAERYYREGQQVLRQQVTESPLLSLLLAAVAGYALAWMIHGRWQGQGTGVPDYGRTRQGYAPHRDRYRQG
jgi:ElaB/YqjD/DUF883 family membrane-anchored ribosome-binding protein